MMGIREYARHRAKAKLPGGTHRAVQAAIKSGRLNTSLTADRKKIKSARAANAEWAASTHEDRVPLSGPTAPGGAASSSAPAPPSDLSVARARREALNADIAALDLAERRGQLVDARAVETRLATVFHFCRTKLLGVTARIAQRDRSLTSAQLALIDGEIRSALEELADKGAPR